MQPSQQVEIQLGHMCNNRCVFCVSGQRTAMGEARPMSADPVIARLDEAFAAGHRKLTLLGGEPTLQPSFMTVVQHAVSLGFEEIVIFTNGVRTARMAVIDEVLATGGNFTWRISIQGATEAAHENTTKKRGSFRRILRTLENLRTRKQRIEVNMCVVSSNLASVPHFAELLLPYGVRQLHLDLVRPLDAGKRTEEEFASMMPRLRDYEAPMGAMADAFDARAPDFDLNIGNLPYCVAPSLLHRTHHDGEHTDTIAVDGDDKLSQPWNKYFVKRRDKVKAAACQQCVMHDACNGVFETYVQLHGLEEVRPISAEDLLRFDPKRRLLARHLRPLTAALRRASSDAIQVRTQERSDQQVEVRLTTRAQRGADSHVVVRLGSARTHGPARYAAHGGFGVQLLSTSGPAIDELLAHLAGLLPEPVVPLGTDMRPVAPSVEARLRKLRAAAPFGTLRWQSTERIPQGVQLCFEDPEGVPAALKLTDVEGRPRGGYEASVPTDAIRQGLREALAVLGAARRERRHSP